MPLALISLLAACGTGASINGSDEDSSGPAPIEIPEHSECLPPGEEYSDEVCIALVEEDGRYPGTSEDKAQESGTDDDPRLTDPDYLWLTGELRRCACRCCHTTSLQGPATYFWDLEFTPVWIDSASSWSLDVLAGNTHEAAQTVQTDDLERAQAVIAQEIERRKGL